MGVAEYIDAIVDLLKSVGVTTDEIDENGTEQKLIRVFLKGVTFEDAARAIFKEHGVEIVQ